MSRSIDRSNKNDRKLKIVKGSKKINQNNAFGINYDNYLMAKEYYNNQKLLSIEELRQYDEDVKLGLSFSWQSYIKVSKTIDYFNKNSEESIDIICDEMPYLLQEFGRMTSIVQGSVSEYEKDIKAYKKERKEEITNLARLSLTEFLKVNNCKNLVIKGKSKVSTIKSSSAGVAAGVIISLILKICFHI